MPSLNIDLTLDGDAFNPYRGDDEATEPLTATAVPEIARILRAYADEIEANGQITTRYLLDVNGNATGVAAYLEG